jgi:signal transduction histidine kinase
MRRTLLALGGFAAVCLVAFATCLGLALAYSARANSFVHAGATQITQAQLAESERYASTARELFDTVGPLAGGMLFAVIAILAIVAGEREVRREPAP